MFKDLLFEALHAATVNMRMSIGISAALVFIGIVAHYAQVDHDNRDTWQPTHTTTEV